MAEWILTDKDIGMDGAYYDYPELIRCKDCKYWGQDGYREGCKYATCVMTEDDYCSWAERKEDDA